MATNYSPKIVTDGLVLCVDPNDEQCWDGSSSTINDLSLSGFSLTKGTHCGSGTWNGQRIFIATATSGTIDTGYRYGTVNVDKVVSSASSWTISGWLLKEGNPDNWWHVWTDGVSGDIFTIYTTTGVFRTSMNATYGTWTTGSDITDYGDDWSSFSNGWVQLVLVYDQANSQLQLYIDTVGQGWHTGRVINTAYCIRNFYGWGSAQSSYHCDVSHSHTVVYDRILSQTEITQNFNAHRSRFGV
ncbi:hypothetical protein HX837_07380 [Marine Group I thaumarchaeote]|uniref:LamG domain-containing protein n=1 Tax=Marine Group I thaumarchaeote TaxID=2511932 RepID=A0A7K4MQZ5_9ARCH|nr:hypothetical protein [Marine Group I thaumarchaeote]